MANKRKETVSVHTQKSIADGIYDLWLDSTLAQDAKAGQFVSVYPNDGAMLLPRPISICEADKENGRLRLVYRVAGGGTGEFSHYTSGQSVSILGTLGNGFPIEKAKGKKVFLIGGGIGIPPMLQLAKELAAADKTANTPANPAAEETANRSADEVTSAAPDKTE
ncbi:MAG: hypothetical protein IJ711_01010, partial [Lachnospiraceae bacterium]|nr:hypothetical protein [Lachnospiraceae bacterium]